MIRIFCESGSPWISAATALLEDQSYEVEFAYGDPNADIRTYYSQYNDWAIASTHTSWHLQPPESCNGLLGVAITVEISVENLQSIVDDVVSVTGGTLP